MYSYSVITDIDLLTNHILGEASLEAPAQACKCKRGRLWVESNPQPVRAKSQ